MKWGRILLGTMVVGAVVTVAMSSRGSKYELLSYDDLEIEKYRLNEELAERRRERMLRPNENFIGRMILNGKIAKLELELNAVETQIIQIRQGWNQPAKAN